jgi:hypothetical protein
MTKLLTGLLLSLFYCTSAQADFDSLYAANLWAVGGPSGNSDGVVDVSGTPGSVTLISNDTGFNNANQGFTFVAFEDATISFDWTCSTVDTGTPAAHSNQWDPFGYLPDTTSTYVSDNSGAVNSGTAMFSVFDRIASTAYLVL